MTSEHLFNKLFYLREVISNVLLRHRKHFLLVMLKGAYFLIILQVTFGMKWLRFIVQYSFYTSLLFSCRSRLKDFVWLLISYLCSYFALSTYICAW